jgi:hypothetical protein
MDAVVLRNLGTHLSVYKTQKAVSTDLCRGEVLISVDVMVYKYGGFFH